MYEETREKCTPCFLYMKTLTENARLVSQSSASLLSLNSPPPRARHSAAPFGTQHSIVPTNHSSWSIAQTVGRLTSHKIKRSQVCLRWGGCKEARPKTECGLASELGRKLSFICAPTGTQRSLSWGTCTHPPPSRLDFDTWTQGELGRGWGVLFEFAPLRNPSSL